MQGKTKVVRTKSKTNRRVTGDLAVGIGTQFYRRYTRCTVHRIHPKLDADQDHWRWRWRNSLLYSSSNVRWIVIGYGRAGYLYWFNNKTATNVCFISNNNNHMSPRLLYI